MNICPAYISKHNNNLIIPNGKGCHYLAIKSLSALIRGITSKHVGDFYCLNCLHSFITKAKFESNMLVIFIVWIVSILL